MHHIRKRFPPKANIPLNPIMHQWKSNYRMACPARLCKPGFTRLSIWSVIQLKPNYMSKRPSFHGIIFPDMSHKTPLKAVEHSGQIPMIFRHLPSRSPTCWIWREFAELLRSRSQHNMALPMFSNLVNGNARNSSTAGGRHNGKLV